MRPNFHEAGEKRKKGISKVEEGAGLDEGRRLLIIRRGTRVRSRFVGSRRSRQPPRRGQPALQSRSQFRPPFYQRRQSRRQPGRTSAGSSHNYVGVQRRSKPPPPQDSSVQISRFCPVPVRTSVNMQMTPHFAPPPPSEEEGGNHREPPWDSASAVKRSQELRREVKNIKMSHTLLRCMFKNVQEKPSCNQRGRTAPKSGNKMVKKKS